MEAQKVASEIDKLRAKDRRRSPARSSKSLLASLALAYLCKVLFN